MRVKWTAIMTLCLLPMALIGLGIIIAGIWALVGFGLVIGNDSIAKIRKQIRRFRR